MTINSQAIKQSATTSATLHPATDVETVTLKIADLARSLTFYTEMIGLHIFEQTATTATLGAGSRRILFLEEVANPQPAPANATGLYHAAILFPDRHALAVKIAQISATRYPLGYGDHLVSEAFYLSDPDGNGLELYRDRPRSEWKWNDSQVQMATDPIDFDSFFAELTENDPALSNPAAPDGTKLGHMHLKVANIPVAKAFYHDVLGFDIVMQMPTALFVSAGGYHHHLGLNIWESRNGKPAAELAIGLREFSIVSPDQAERDRLIKQIEAAGIAVDTSGSDPVVLDPFQNRIRLTVAG